MNISHFGTDTNTIDQQVADVKAYATANYAKRGWNIVTCTMTDAEIADILGKRKNTRAAIYAMFAHIKPIVDGLKVKGAEAQAQIDGASAPAVEQTAPDAEPTDEEMDPAAARRAKRTAQQRARREAARAAA